VRAVTDGYQGDKRRLAAGGQLAPVLMKSGVQSDAAAQFNDGPAYFD
jgi:hypothetical protein